MKSIRGIFLASVVLLATTLASAATVSLEQAPDIQIALFCDMLAHLPPMYVENARVMELYRDPSLEVNAYASYLGEGRPVIVVTRGAFRVMGTLAFYTAAERTGHRVQPDFDFNAPTPHQVLRVPPNWREEFRDPAFERVWLQSLRSISCFVMAHEMGHHCMGHTRQAFLAKGLGTTQRNPLSMARMMRQDQELEADRFGVYAVGWNGLDYGSVATFCRYMHLCEPKVTWKLVTDHPNWKARERHVKMIVQSLR